MTFITIRFSRSKLNAVVFSIDFLFFLFESKSQAGSYCRCYSRAGLGGNNRICSYYDFSAL